MDSSTALLPEDASWTEYIFPFLRQTGRMIRYILAWFFHHPGEIYSQLIRWVFPVLAILIVASVLRHMMRVKNPQETWGYLVSPQLGRYGIHHWETIVGRSRHCDLIVKYATISRTQCALIRDDDGNWSIHNLSDKYTTKVNNKLVRNKRRIKYGDAISIGGVNFLFEAITEQEHEMLRRRRSQMSVPHPPWNTLILLSVFQFLSLIQFLITRPDHRLAIFLSFLLLAGLMWGYVLLTRAAGQTGFEPEILAFFACTLNLAVTASSSPGSLLKQTLTIAIGIVLFMMMGWYLRDLERVVRIRHFMAGAAIALFTINILFGQLQFGARNWISLFGVSIQPSEIAKICFIFAGAATLDRLFVKRNLFGFMLLSGFCLAALAITGDFGTAAVFFVTFLIIAFMRSGDYATLALICGATMGAILLVLRFKPYIASRVNIWGHVWEDPSGMGYQQVRTMSAAASGGLIGTGPGKGWLRGVAASNTDLVFGLLCEEWGLIIAVLSVLIIVAFSIFAFRVTRSGRSSYYTIAACAATSLFVFQTILNVFGSVDLLPLTGVTFPFVSTGGSSMIASWGLLSFVKAADTRPNASFAVRKKTALGDVPDDPYAVSEIENLDPGFLSRTFIGKIPSASRVHRKRPEATARSDDGEDNRRNKKRKLSFQNRPTMVLKTPAAAKPERKKASADFDRIEKNDDDIERFLKQFENNPEQDGANIDDFLRQFDGIPVEDSRRDSDLSHQDTWSWPEYHDPHRGNDR